MGERFLFAILILNIATIGSGVLADDHGSSQKPTTSAAQATEEPVSAAMSTVLERIRRMENIVNGKEPAPKTDESEPFLLARSTLVDKYVKELIEALDNGKLEAKLGHVLIEGEAYTNIEHAAVFEVDGKDTFEALSKEEKNQAALAYTRSRKTLRLALLTDLAKALEKQGDPRALLLADAVRGTIKESQRSYDLAVQNITDNDLDRPICFTCGEAVAKLGTLMREGEDLDYEFFQAMGDAATAALKSAKIQSRDGHVVVPHFDPSRKTFTYDGEHFLERGKERTRRIYKSPTGSILLAEGAAPGKILDTRQATQKELFDLWLDYRNEPSKHKVGAKLPGSASTVPSLAAKTEIPRDPKVTAFEESNRASSQSLEDLYPTADMMAKALGLVDAEGKSLLVHKNDHWSKDEEGTPKADFNEYGVSVRWAAIDALPPARKAEVLAILKAVQRGSISDYKVVRQDKDGKEVGYCLWCNLNNDSASVTALSGQ
ncbi:MAG: hypothetical protein KDD51_07520 [Bdellovibrionales bacterium]|nr:hypothetical protein [Bdellovibrionales bacterium]